MGVLRGAPHHGRLAVRQFDDECVMLVGMDHRHDLRLHPDRDVTGGQAVEKLEGGRVGRDEAVFRRRRRRRRRDRHVAVVEDPALVRFELQEAGGRSEM